MEIQVELEDISPVKKRLRVEIPAEVAGREFQLLAGEYRRRARVPGFRPGKAPLELVKRHYRNEIRDDLLQRLIPEAFDQAMREGAIEPLGRPHLDNLRFQEGEAVAFEALFEVAPQFDLPRYQGLEVSIPEGQFTEEDVEKQLLELRRRHGRMIPVEDRPIQAGDFAQLDLKGNFLGAEGLPDLSESSFRQEAVVIKVGDEQTHPAFSRALTGLKVSDEAVFEVAYEKDYPEEKLAGKRVRFEAEVTDIRCEIIPELDDEFAREVGDFESVEDLREKLKERLAQSFEEGREQLIRQRLLLQLIETTRFEVPETLVENALDDFVRDLAVKIASRGLDPSRSSINWAGMREEHRPQAEKQVRVRLILERIAEQEGFVATEEEVRQRIEAMAEELGEPMESVRSFFARRDRRQDIEERIRREKALEHLRGSAVVRTLPADAQIVVPGRGVQT